MASEWLTSGSNQPPRIIDQIIDYTRQQWDEAQAERYIDELFACFAAIAAREIRWRLIPASFGVAGYFHRYRHHYVYWMELPEGRIAILSILHERMDQSSVLIGDVEP